MANSTLAWDLTKRYVRNMVRSPVFYFGLTAATIGQYNLRNQDHKEIAPKQEINTTNEINPFFETIKEEFKVNLNLLDDPVKKEKTPSRRIVDSPVEAQNFVPASRPEKLVL